MSSNTMSFDTLVQAHQQRISKLVSGYLHDPRDVQDVTQEVFIKAYKALPKFRGDSSLYTWLHRIAINTAFNHRVAQSRRPPSSGVDVYDAELFGESFLLIEQDTPEKLLLRDEILKLLEDAIDKLPSELKEAFTLSEIQGTSYAEISRIMKCPLGTTKSRISRARIWVHTRLHIKDDIDG